MIIDRKTNVCFGISTSDFTLKLISNLANKKFYDVRFMHQGKKQKFYGTSRK